ncbi:MAG TPA: PaaX family transcriptional regulator C-terminal domain-containing protein [Sporichthyaceae bacterium]|nr:PaaX family transcriptional regulator C-terminal domain-containing protein [Sporichthyaceae bacterium]
MTAVSESPAQVGAQPRQLIVSLYGLYARQNDGWLSVASLIRLMADLGVDEQAVRSSTHRLKRRGLLDAEKVDGVAGYRLSGHALEVLAAGDARIFGRRRATVADGWLLVVFSVPESERDKRHQLRSELAHLGFGTVAPGVWIAPGHLEAEAVEAVEQLEVSAYAQVFRGPHVAFGELRDKVAQWWDLDALRALYAEFLDRYRPLRERWAAGTGENGARAFADFVEMLTAWRQLPYADPGLPLDLLPPDWNAVEAEQLFADLREILAVPAGGHAHTVLAAARR